MSLFRFHAGLTVLARCGAAAILLAVSLAASGFAAPPKTDLKLDPQRISSFYQKIKRIEATLVQTKTAPYLIKPLKSDIELTVHNDVITWQVRSGRPFTLTISDNKMEMVDENGKPLLSMNDKGAALSAPFMTTLSALIKGDMVQLQKSHEVTAVGSTLKLRAREAKDPIREIEFRLDKNLAPVQITLYIGEEKVQLDFVKFKAE
jgi:hypothetical protein